MEDKFNSRPLGATFVALFCAVEDSAPGYLLTKPVWQLVRLLFGPRMLGEVDYSVENMVKITFVGLIYSIFYINAGLYQMMSAPASWMGDENPFKVGLSSTMFYFLLSFYAIPVLDNFKWQLKVTMSCKNEMRLGLAVRTLFFAWERLKETGV